MRLAKNRLIKVLDNYNWRLGTGFLSAPLILYVLADIDIEYAYKLLKNEEMPGWLYMAKSGATTIWEGWEGPNSQSGISSLNHYSKGVVLEWAISKMRGINVEKVNHFTISPHPGGDFTFVKASYKSIYGEAKCGWKKTDNIYRYHIEIPTNCTASVKLPNGTRKEIGSGIYKF